MNKLSELKRSAIDWGTGLKTRLHEHATSASVYLVLLVLSGCGTPFSVSGGFFGASVSVDFPEGIKPVPVTKTASVLTPTLMVPPDSSITSGTVPVTTASGQTASVPVAAAPVTSPILAVPAK